MSIQRMYAIHTSSVGTQLRGSCSKFFNKQNTTASGMITGDHCKDELLRPLYVPLGPSIELHVIKSISKRVGGRGVGGSGK